MKIRWIIILSLYFNIYTLGQNNCNCSQIYVQAATKMMWHEQYEESVAYYRRALDNHAYFTREDYINASLMFLKVNSPHEAYICLDKAIEQGLNQEEISKDSILNAFLNIYPGNTLCFTKTGNRQTETEIFTAYINSVFELDQWIRYDENLPFKDKGKVFQVIDSVFVFRQLVEMLDNLSSQALQLDKDARENLIIMLRHQTGYTSQFEQLIPGIKALLEAHVINNLEYAQIIDSYLLRKQGKQRYATHYVYDEIANVALLQPLENTKEINEKRLLIGLRPVFMEIEEDLTDIEMGEEKGRKGHRFKRLPIQKQKELLDEYLTSKCAHK